MIMREGDWIDLIISIADYSIIPEFMNCEIVEYRNETEIFFFCYFEYNIVIDISYNRHTEDITVYSVKFLGEDETYELSFLSSGMMEWGERIINDYYHDEIIYRISNELEEFSDEVD